MFKIKAGYNSALPLLSINDNLKTASCARYSLERILDNTHTNHCEFNHLG